MTKKFTLFLTAQDTEFLHDVAIVINTKDKSYEINMDPQKKKSEDPGWWYLQAYGFYSTFKILLDLFKSSPSKSFIGTSAVYTLGIATELYLKTFLLISGYPYQDVINFKHDLKNLRLECHKIDTNFDNSDLIFITDNLGSVIMDNGGIRYPVNSKSAAVADPIMIDAISWLDSYVRLLISIETKNTGGLEYISMKPVLK